MRLRSTGGLAAPPAVSLGRGYGLVAASVSLFVINAGVSRLVLRNGVGPVDLAAVRAAGTAVALGGWLIITRGPGAFRLRRAEVVPLLVYGVLGVALLQVAYFVAVDRLNLGLALLLEYQAPLLVALWSRFVAHRPVGRLLWPALGVTIVGLALVASPWKGASLDLIGVAAGLVAAVSFASYYLIGERMVQSRDALTTTFWGFAVAGVLWSAVTPWWRVVAETSDAPVPLPQALGGGEVSMGWLVCWVVVAGTLAPFAATTAALHHLPATAVTSASTFEPVGASLLGWWWFAESMTSVQVLGGMLVIAGILGAQRARRTASRPTRGPTLER